MRYIIRIYEKFLMEHLVNEETKKRCWKKIPFNLFSTLKKDSN